MEHSQSVAILITFIYHKYTKTKPNDDSVKVSVLFIIIFILKSFVKYLSNISEHKTSHVLTHYDLVAMKEIFGAQSV